MISIITKSSTTLSSFMHALYKNSVLKRIDPLNTAVLLLIYNRQETTAQVFQAIRKAKPPRLYVAADGPKEDKEGDLEKVEKVLEIATNVDWPCEVNTLIRDINLGCKLSVSGAITWFFENEEQGIILEDDCLPSQSFFWFCERMLEKYKNNEQIFIISGYNKQNQWNPQLYDYFFSSFGGIWGWASWRRAWKYYDGDMDGLEALTEKSIFEFLLGKEISKLCYHELISAKQKIDAGTMDTWAYPWALSRLLERGKACVPSRSLISNIGFGEDATHTMTTPTIKVQHQDIGFPIKDNPFIIPDRKYDLLLLKESTPTIRIGVFHRLKRLLAFLFYT